MFRGSFPHSIDEKGRVAIPVKWRDQLSGAGDDRLVLTRFIVDGERCLDVYPYGEWTQLEDLVKQKPRFSRAVVKFENYYMSRTHDCIIDKQGRILVPPQLREYAGLEKDVVFAGALTKFRMFNAQVWERVDRSAEQTMIDDPGFLEGLDL
jgi:MraZ protein